MSGEYGDLYAEVLTVDQIPEVARIWDNPPQVITINAPQILASVSLPHIIRNPFAFGVFGMDRGDGGKGTWTNELAHYMAAELEMEGVAVRGGGPGAGHEAYPPGFEEAITHRILPCVFDSSWQVVVGRGELGWPDIIWDEIKRLGELGINNTPERIMIDGAAPLVWEAHAEIDAAQERWRGKDAVGTTKSGVGPAAADYVGRNTLEFYDLLSSEADLREKVYREVDKQNRQLAAWGSEKRYDPNQVYQQFLLWSRDLGPYIKNTRPVIMEAIKKWGFIYEGAQGFGISLETGFRGSVTSTDSGPATFGHRYRTSIFNWGFLLGVTKFVPTGVGHHIYHAPLLQEQTEALYAKTGQRGSQEKGRVTGRNRRYYLYPVPDVIAAMNTYHLNAQLITKGDIPGGVLSKYLMGLEYVFPDGQTSADFDPDNPPMRDKGTKMRVLEMDCWPNIDGLSNWHDAPRELRAAVATVARLTRLPVVGVKTGPRYGETIFAEGFLEKP